MLYFISVKIFISLCLKNSNTSASTVSLSLFNTPHPWRASKAFKEISNPELSITFTIPRAALLRANGSFEPLGITPTPKHPTNVSNLSEIPATIPSNSVGRLSPWNLG